MKATSKHVFAVLAQAVVRSSARRSLVVSMVGALAIGLLPTVPGAQSQIHIATTPAAGGAWLNRLNMWRASSGLSNLTENATYSAGDYKHSLYMVKNDEVAHSENPTHPYYTVAGDTAARNSNIQVSSTTSTSDSQAIDWWMAAPFHAISMMDPLLASTGFGAYRQVKSGWQAGFSLDTSRGRLSSGGRYPVYYPGNGATEPLRTFDGHESPDPLQACSGYTAPTGLPVIIQVGSNIATTAGAHSFTGNGVALQHCVIDSRNAALGSSLKWHGGVILIPKAPLQNGVHYVVVLTVNGVPYTWSFTVGPLSFPPPACESASLTSDKTSPQPGGTSVTFTASAAGTACTSPLYQFWIWSAATGWVIKQPYSSVATFALDTTGMKPGTYSVDVWVEQSGSLHGTGGYETYGLEAWTVGGCDFATLSPNPAPTTGPVLFTAAAGGIGCGTPLYQYWLWSASAGWVLKQPYSTTNTYLLDTSTLAGGTYSVDVWVKQQGSPLGYETWALSTVPKNVCGTTTITPSGASPQTVGSAINFTTMANGCNSPEYQYWIFPGAAGNWQMLSDYNPNGAFSWSTAGVKPGTYSIVVHVREAASSAPFDTWGLLSYSVTGSSSAGMSASPISPQAIAIPVTLTSSSPASSSQFKIWMYPPGGPWTLVQDFSTNTAINWDTSLLRTGTYSWVVYVKQTGSGSSYDSYALLNFSVT